MRHEQTFEAEAPDGTQWRVIASARLPASEDDGPLRVERRAREDAPWRPVPLRVHWRSWLAARASDWPPERIDGAGWRDGALRIDYENRWDPHRPEAPSRWQLDAHAKWRSKFDARSQTWPLVRVRLIGTDEPATR